MKKVLPGIFALMLVCMGVVCMLTAIGGAVLAATGLRDGSATYSVTLIAGFCGLMVFACLLHLFLIRRLKRLSQGVKEVAGGNYDVKLKTAGWDEIASLTEDFNAMARELKASETLSLEFIRNASHELKTPLSVLKGYADWLQSPDLTPEEQSVCLGVIAKEVDRAENVVGKMLELARLQSSDRLDKKDRFRIDEQIRDVILAMQVEWMAKGAEFDVEPEEVEIVGNCEMTYHIWQNLISNAVRFVDRGGKITVRLKQEDCVVCTVANTGVPLPKEEQPLNFQPFYRGMREDRAQGSGLGLAIVQKIVEKSGGKIGVETTEKETIFRVKL